MVRQIFVVVAFFLIVFSAGLAFAQSTVTVVGQDVSLIASDGAKIAGTFYEAKGKGPAVICLHMMRRNRTDWENFALEMVNRKISVLAIDLRGHGQSTKKEDGTKLLLDKFTKRDYRDMVLDVEAAMQFLKKNKVKMSRVGIVGASIGANVGLVYAAKHPGDIKALALLSPGLDYRSVKTPESMGVYEGPVFIAAGKYDEYSAKSVELLAKIHPERCEKIINADPKHGTNMLKGKNDLTKKLADWLAGHL